MSGEDIAEVAELDRETGSSWAILHFDQHLTAPCSFHFVVRHKLDRTLCGFICGQLVGLEAEIHKILVAKPYRRRSVATTLMRHTLKFLTDQKATSCFLELRATNPAAKCLYSNFNFRTVARRKKYYTAPPEDAIIMKLEAW